MGLIPILDAIEMDPFCRLTVRHSDAIIRLNIAEITLGAADVTHLDERLARSVARSDCPIADLQPKLDPFLWLGLYRVNSVMNGFNADDLKFLRMSYEEPARTEGLGYRQAQRRRSGRISRAAGGSRRHGADRVHEAARARAGAICSRHFLSGRAGRSATPCSPVSQIRLRCSGKHLPICCARAAMTSLCRGLPIRIVRGFDAIDHCGRPKEGRRQENHNRDQFGGRDAQAGSWYFGRRRR